jgi:hypothetical protein
VDAVRLEVERERAGLRAGSGVVAATARETEEHRDQGKESAHGGEQYGEPSMTRG